MIFFNSNNCFSNLLIIILIILIMMNIIIFIILIIILNMSYPRWLGMTNMHIPSHEHGCIFIVIFFLKTKKAPNSKIKISIIHTATQKIQMDHFVSNYSFNTKCIL